MKRLTKAQRRVLAGMYRRQGETLANPMWRYTPNYGERGRSYYGIIDKLIRRGYISKHQIVLVSPTYLVSINLVTIKGVVALYT